MDYTEKLINKVHEANQNQYGAEPADEYNDDESSGYVIDYE